MWKYSYGIDANIPEAILEQVHGQLPIAQVVVIITFILEIISRCVLFFYNRRK